MPAKARLTVLCAFFAGCRASAQEMPKSRPSIWAGKSDVKVSEAGENAHLATAQAAIDRLLAVNSLRTVQNTVAMYDEAIQHLNTASKLAGLISKLIPTSPFGTVQQP